MIKLYDDARQVIAAPLAGCINICEEETLATGDKLLTFEYRERGQFAHQIKLEGYVETKTAWYVLKQQEPGSKEGWIKYTAQLDVEELESKQYTTGATWTGQSIAAVCEELLEGTGWALLECDITKRRTIKMDQPCSAWDIVQQIATTYRAVPVLDNREHTISFYNADTYGEYRGAYFMARLNLRKLSVTRDTYDFATRLYIIGKDGLTAGTDEAHTYLENHEYSEKVKAATWKDERYTDPDSLLEDGEAKLAEMSRPYESYETEIRDLANLNKKYKGILDYKLGDRVLLIDKGKNLRQLYRIVKTTTYPQNPESNTAELANTKLSFAELQKQDQDAASADAASAAEQAVKQELGDGSATLQTIIDAAVPRVLDNIDEELARTYATKQEMRTAAANATEDAIGATATALQAYRTAEDQDAATDEALAAAAIETERKLATIRHRIDRADAAALWLAQQIGLEDEYRAWLEEQDTTAPADPDSPEDPDAPAEPDGQDSEEGKP